MFPPSLHALHDNPSHRCRSRATPHTPPCMRRAAALQEDPSQPGDTVPSVSSSVGLGGGAKDAVVVVHAPLHRSASIYDLKTKRQTYTILAVIAIASVIVPFTDTIYLPALKVRTAHTCVTVLRHQSQSRMHACTTSSVFSLGGF